MNKPVAPPTIEMFGPWITEHEERIVLDALRNGWYGKTAYSYCEMFEREFAEYHGRRHALMTPNCTTSIHLLLASLGIGPGDEVIVPECTWIASVAPVVYQRATPVFADVDPVHWCLTPRSVEAKLTSKTKAIILVDVYGNMPDWDEMQALADSRGIALVEDSAEALGSTYGKRRAGSLGIGSVFSFHRTKTIVTGEGGAVLVDDEKLFAQCKLLRDHGRAPGAYYNTTVGFKYMPSNLQASLAHAQFERIDDLVGRKREILALYREHLADVPDILLNFEKPDRINGAWCTALLLGKSHRKSAEQVMAAMREKGLPSRAFFHPLTSLPAFGSRGAEMSKVNPVAYSIIERGIILPSAYTLSNDDVARVAAGLRDALR